MKKLLLVNTNTEKFPYPVPPIGLGMLATVLHDLYEVKVYDGVFDDGNNLINVAREFQPDYIGLSIRNIDDMVLKKPNYYVESIFENFIKPLKNFNVPLILGGSGFSIYPTELMDYFKADYGIIGEGEKSLPILLSRLDLGLEIKNIPGIIVPGQPNTKFEIIPNNNTCHNFPDSNIDKYIDFNPYIKRGFYSLQTKRGCSHSCIYCTYPLIEGKKLRIRTAESIVNEIKQVQDRLGFQNFEFVDSIFNDPAGWAEEICNEILKQKVKANFRTMGINPENTGKKLFELMLEAGFSQIDCTPDSGSVAMLKNLGKNFSLSKLQETADLLRHYNIPTMWFFTFGGPGETKETIKETFDFVDNYIGEQDMVHMTTGLRIYPNTHLHKTAIEEKVVCREDDLLQPTFYVSPNFSIDQIDIALKEAANTRPNCIPSSESTPPGEMMAEAFEMREKDNLTEPMFRTLMRIRNKKFNASTVVKS